MERAYSSRHGGNSARRRHLRSRAGGAVRALGALLLWACAGATPPNYQTYRRDQVTSYSPNESAMLRIWVAYVGQGDAILIQFPRQSTSAGDAVEMLVDGGPNGNQLEAFLRALYPTTPVTIEHAVLTHHDEDHVEGLTTLLKRGAFRVTNLYHTGLASWKLGSPVFSDSSWPSADTAVVDKKGNRGMAHFDPKPAFGTNALVRNLSQLVSGIGGYGKVYDKFAEAVRQGNVAAFPRVHLDNADLPASVGQVRLTPLWPSLVARGYGTKPGKSPTWSHSINGNSVVFRLDYGQFSMLFTGDLNEDSETELLDALRQAGRLGLLNTDVLKLPHHGSGHSIAEFFPQVNPVLSVASMGGRGFSKSWKHPSTQVIQWLGGAHRVYHTYIEESPFAYKSLTAAARAKMEELKHVLIETDGVRFRFVEVEDPALAIPTVAQVGRGNGTRWIDAREQ